MRNGIFQTAKQRVFNRQLRSPSEGRVRLLFALVVSVLALGVAARVTLAQEPPQPAPPQQAGIGQSEPERQLDAQAQTLEARRTELVRSLQQAEMRLQQLVLEQEQQRRALQKELSDIRERLREVENQLADLPRQRLRAKYLAALQTLEQARGKRQQAEDQAETARLAEQDAALAVDRLRQLQGQRPSIPPESVRGEPPREKRTEVTERELQERPNPDQRRGPELAEGLQARQEPLCAVPPQGHAAGKARAKQDHAEARRDGVLQQLEHLRRCTGERIRGVAAQVDIAREDLNREISVVRTDVQRMGWTLGRIEQERLDAQTNLETSVAELRGHVEHVQQLCQTQRTLDIALMQPHISTVGSAAYR